jgi:hypothetical protein
MATRAHSRSAEEFGGMSDPILRVMSDDDVEVVRAWAKALGYTLIPESKGALDYQARLAGFKDHDAMMVEYDARLAEGERA